MPTALLAAAPAQGLEPAPRRSWWDDIARFLLDGAGQGPSENSQAAPVPAEVVRARQACRILVVDDDASIRVTVSEFLEDEGFQVETAPNGRAALELVLRQQPTLILLDMRMPIMDGWAFADELRARGIIVPIVVMTAAQDARRWADEIGATAYVAKPFDFPSLLTIFDRLCVDP